MVAVRVSEYHPVNCGSEEQPVTLSQVFTGHVVAIAPTEATPVVIDDDVVTFHRATTVVPGVNPDAVARAHIHEMYFAEILRKSVLREERQYTQAASIA